MIASRVYVYFMNSSGLPPSISLSYSLTHWLCLCVFVIRVGFLIRASFAQASAQFGSCSSSEIKTWAGYIDIKLVRDYKA